MSPGRGRLCFFLQILIYKNIYSEIINLNNDNSSSSQGQNYVIKLYDVINLCDITYKYDVINLHDVMRDSWVL